MTILRSALILLLILHPSSLILSQDRLEPIQYNNPGLVVDLGVGLWAWPLPMDYDRDGDLDLVVSCPDKPYNGTYFFENPGKLSVERPVSSDSNTQYSTLNTQPVFKPAVRIANGLSNVQVSYVGGEPIVMTPGKIYDDFREHQYDNPIQLPLPEKIDPRYQRYRANQWKLVDWEGDGDLDVTIGIGIWDDYGWDDAWDENGNWKNGPLHGFVYLVENIQDRLASPQRGERLEPWKTLPDNTPWPDSLGPRPVYAAPVKVEAGGKPVDVYGMPSPNFADFDGDGDLDLICGEFLDGFTWFENTGTRQEPVYQAGRPVAQKHAAMHTPDQRVRLQPPRLLDQKSFAFRLNMDLQMITPVAVDWNSDGAVDLVAGDEDGRVAWCQNLNQELLGGPSFRAPRYFQQVASDVKFGALVTPFSIDWDHDGDEDLVCGNTAGYIGLIENLGGEQPQWDRPALFVQEYLSGGDLAIHKTLRHQAGPKGSIQGPCEAKWGYTTVTLANWSHGTETYFKGLKPGDSGYFPFDVLVNDIWGNVTVHYSQPVLNRDNSVHPSVSMAQPVFVNWEGQAPKPEWVWWTPEPNTLTTQWRTTPCALDWNGDGRCDLIMLDHEGYLAFYERSDHVGEQPSGSGHSTLNTQPLLPPKRIFKIEGPSEFDSRHRPVGDKKDGLLRLNANRAGASGRRKLCFADWDGDGRLDLLVNSVNVNWLRNVRTDEKGFVWFQDMGQLDDRVLAGHTTSPTTVDWDKNGIPDLLVGAEDGRLYYKRNPRAAMAHLAPHLAPGDSPGANLVAVSNGACASIADGQSAELTREFIYDSAPFPECHASTIVETPIGLVAAWFGGTKEGRDDVGIWSSRQVDGKWTESVEVANGVRSETLRYPCWNPVLFQWPDGPLQLYYKVGPNPREWWGQMMESTDGGVTWSEPRRLPATILGPVKNKPVLLPNGELLCGSSSEHNGWRIHMEVTPYEGRNWERIGPIESAERFNAIQPTILVHHAGASHLAPADPPAAKLQILCRSREGNIVTSWSTDNGRTWSPLERTSLPNPNSGIDAVTMKDGRHVLIYNHTPRGRSPLNLAVSEDGVDWKAGLVLETERGEFSYPAVIQTADGLLHITYTWKRQKVRHVIVDPNNLKDLKPIADGQWPEE